MGILLDHVKAIELHNKAVYNKSKTKLRLEPDVQSKFCVQNPGLCHYVLAWLCALLFLVCGLHNPDFATKQTPQTMYLDI